MVNDGWEWLTKEWLGVHHLDAPILVKVGMETSTHLFKPPNKRPACFLTQPGGGVEYLNLSASRSEWIATLWKALLLGSFKHYPQPCET